MKNVLIIGAGMVAPPAIKYLSNQEDFQITLCDSKDGIEIAKQLGELFNKNNNIMCNELDVKNKTILGEFVSDADIVLSLVPRELHYLIAEACLKEKKNLVTPSYCKQIKEKISDLENKTEEAGVIILNECGLDPGIDHMSAMKIIHGVEEKGGKIISFRSTTGALPAYKSNNNPFGYKFSWSPRGVLQASRNAAKWLENGDEVSVPGEQLFENYIIQDVPGVGSFENYPNRDSVEYKDLYGLKDAKTVYRGTFRMVGWCETLRKIVALGWLSEEPVQGFIGKTYGDLTRYLIGAGLDDDLPFVTAKFLNLEPYSAIIKRLEWLGLIGEEILSSDNTPLDYLNILTLKKMSLGQDESDMVVMYHEIIAEDSEGVREKITSTLVDVGTYSENMDTFTSIAKTTGLTAAICVRYILEGTIDLKGLFIPTKPEIYNLVLQELRNNNIQFTEKREKLTEMR